MKIRREKEGGEKWSRSQSDFHFATNSAYQSSSPMEQTSFTDDAAFIAATDNPKLPQEIAQKAIDKAVEWADGHGFRFSTTKTQVLFMTQKHEIHNATKTEALQRQS